MSEVRTVETTNGKNGHGRRPAAQLAKDLTAKVKSMAKDPAVLRQALLAQGIDPADLVEQEADPAPKRRGRPRKNAQPDAEVAEVAEIEGEAAEKPAKRGRKAKAEAEKEQVIQLAPLRLEVIAVEVEGLSPLLQHKWDEKNLKEIRDRNTGKVNKDKGARDFRNPEEEFNGARYIDRKGRDCCPAVQFKKAMAAVAAEKAIHNVTKASIFRWVQVTSMDRSSVDLVPIEHDQKQPRCREDMVRVGPFGKRVAMLRYRPEYNNWRCQIQIQFNASVISAEQMVNLLNWAGMGIGIGEWRPEKSGDFGRFRVVRTLNEPGQGRGRGRKTIGN